MGSYLDKLLLGLKAVYNNGTKVVFRPNVNLIGASFADNPTLNSTDVTLGGAVAVVTTTGDFTQPAVGSNVNVSVTSTASFPAGINVFVQHGGYYSVASVTDSAHFVLTNFGTPGNASPGTTVPSGSIVASSGPPAQDLYFFHERANGRFWVTDPLFGAVGDGTTNDGPAIQSAENARAAAGGAVPGAVLLFPPATYSTNQQLQIKAAGASWLGASGYGVVTLKAGAAIQSVIASSFNRCVFRDFRCDANRLANYSVLRAGDGLSLYDHITSINALLDGFSSILWQLPGRGSPTVSHTGTGPTISGGNITLSNVKYGNFQGSSVWIKIVTGGAVGTATFVMSVDGVTYASATNGAQTIQSTTQIADGRGIDPSGHAYLGQDMGVMVGFPAGTYVSGDIYQISWTFSPSNGNAVNDSTTFLACQAGSCGSIFRTSGAFSFPSAPNVTTVTGTLSSVAGSNILTGDANTHLLATGARPGDFVYHYGNNTWYQILCILDDKTMAIGFASFATIGSHATQDFIIAVGWGFYDPQQPDANIQSLVTCSLGQLCANGVSMSGVIGNSTYTLDVSGVDAVSLSIGLDNQTVVNGCALVRPYFEPLNNTVAIELYNTTPGLSVIEPSNFARSGPGFELILDNGVLYGITRAREDARQINTGNRVAINSDGLTLTPPTMGFNGTGTSFLTLNPNADHTLGNLSVPSTDGLVVYLFNESTLYNLTLTSSPLGPNWVLQAPMVTLGPTAMMRFVAFNGLWYQDSAVSRAWQPSSTPNVPGDGEHIITTTNATSTEIYRIFAATGDSAILGVSADITGSASGGTVGATYEDVRARFAQGTMIGAMTIGHQTGTDAGGVPPAAWGGVSFATVSGVWAIQVTGAASTTIAWRCRVRFF